MPHQNGICDGTSDEKSMRFSVFHCVGEHLMRHLGVPPKYGKWGPPDELKNGRGRGWAATY